MAETFALGSLVIPGPYVQVRAEGLIGAPAVSTGNIGVVGTAAQGVGTTRLVSTYAEAQAAFGPYDEFADGDGTLNLTRGLEVLYRNGGGAVFARGLAAGANEAAFTAAFNELVKDDVNILVAPELSTDDAKDVLAPILESAENAGRDLIAVVGSDVDPESTDALTKIKGQVPTNDRLIMVTPGMVAFDQAEGSDVALPGTYSAVAVAGLLSTLSVQTSATNKELPGVGALAFRYSYAETENLVNGRLLVLEQRGGVRVVRALTTDDGAFRRITTRRIVDFAKAGVRGVSRPFIGKLNNQRVRAALQGAISGFLTSMLVDEALVGFNLSVTATRDDEIAGRAMVNIVLQPVFELEFIPITLILE
jgi:phage tail sheath protein FI